MLCCVGLIGGMAVGQALGGPWTYIAPAAGFGLGLIGDMKFMKGMHSKGAPHATGLPGKKDGDPVRGVEVAEGKAGSQVEHMGVGSENSDLILSGNTDHLGDPVRSRVRTPATEPGGGGMDGRHAQATRDPGAAPGRAHAPGGG